MARPKANIDFDLVDKYLQAHCDGAAIASMIGVHKETLYDRIVAEFGEEYGISNFSDYAAIKRSEGKEMLRNKMFEQAMGGDKTMQIWLSKQYLGMSDKQEIEHKGVVLNFDKDDAKV
jgi:hypothetical protein